MPDIVAALERIIIYAVPLLLGVTCHEVAHGFVAYLQGDRTAKNAGRLTLNPLKHLDPMGSLVFVVLAMFSPVVLGWAKPVPVNPRHFKDPRKGMMLVSIAGPAVNFILAIIFALVVRVFLPFATTSAPGPMLTYVLDPLLQICYAGVLVNNLLGIFNLIPIPPMDGSKILAGILPDSLAMSYMRLERYGMLVILILLATGLFGRLVVPTVDDLTKFLVFHNF